MIYRNTYTLIRSKIDEIQEAIKQNSKDIKRAADFGDLKENAEYHAAKENQVLLHDKLRRYEQFLHNEVVEPHEIDLQHVGFGTKVTYRDGERDVTIAVAGSAEYELDLYDNICTTQSPLAQQILGKKIGEEVTVTLPGGEKTLTIKEIQRLE
ncbi:MAG: GreA/GreB family elongation factor [Lentisphaeria bacterium]|nr:GreA/GreB family elongation factor [Candidatus Neomarinimicrobiota bacterium]MCF7842155.1 GreA/GreB family elongation factor [Lentisphaeria bacterium]